ncbi:MAG: O-antigen ligase family protein [Gammaproteobacteria bacterium]|nr:MAG: O-antigen ligase family protein [Gammaproteobacteria bacterium]RLA54976.1 MAG: O-antigen ligase family protein [Gammaproteobacteria bacterium]
MRHSGPADRVPFIVFTGLLLWLPIPLGSNRPWAAMLSSGIIFVLCIWWSVLFLKKEVSIHRSFRKAWPAITALLMCQCWVFISAITPYSPSSDFVVPAPPAAYFTVGSLDPAQSFQQLILGLALTALFCLTLVLLNSRQRIKTVIYALILSGVCQAVYGSLMTLSNVEYILFLPKESNTGVTTGTFINRNHLAGYLELCLAVGIGFMIATLNDRPASTWRDVGRRILEALLGAKARVRIGIVMMVAALVMTHSRMGNTAFFASMAITGIIALIFSKRASKPTIILLTSLVIIDILVVGTFFGIDRVVERIEETTLETTKRDEVDVYALGLLRDHPITGTGAGSFYGVFPQYRQEEVGNVYFDHAHNDYLQFAIEFGLLGFVPLAAFVFFTLITALGAQWQRRDALMRGLSFSTIMAIIAFGIHSTVDFNLQIPANAATFMIILAMGWLSMFFRDSSLKSGRGIP